ncbi:hypothetical protein BN1723_006736 [Verticillium longisporum]|uniref:Uncharacterized protein n=1 Tax=Verticillium longisporum TaxID=100787 RepID=A0A0G4NHG1_VERLO|nr:hypothetical protein BN1708_002212 [Verticillium longisporum]CRK45828.1 hypothetical protein BN1723_006736 [Verticillium longisporum]
MFRASGYLQRKPGREWSSLRIVPILPEQQRPSPPPGGRQYELQRPWRSLGDGFLNLSYDPP